MKVYDSFDDFWRSYFDNQSDDKLDTWTIAKFLHTTDADYQQLKNTGRDTLGYQPTHITLADPKRQTAEEVIIKNLPTISYDSLRQQYNHRFISQLPYRFGLFNPDSKQADAIYQSWEEFAGEWFEKDGKSMLKYNLPLLFDHVSDAAYWSWRHKGFDPCGTQRLIVTVFQYRTGRFAEVFITDVTDAEMSRIKLLIQSKLALAAEEIL